MAITAATADTTEAMELIAVQMLSIGYLLSAYNNYNIKLVIVFKSDTPIRVDYRPCSEVVTGIPTPNGERRRHAIQQMCMAKLLAVRPK